MPEANERRIKNYSPILFNQRTEPVINGQVTNEEIDMHLNYNLLPLKFLREKASSCVLLIATPEVILMPSHSKVPEFKLVGGGPNLNP